MITVHFYLNLEKELEGIFLAKIHDGYLLPLDKWSIERLEEDLANEIDYDMCDPDNHYKVKMKLNYERDGAGAMQVSHWSIVEMFYCTRII